MLCVNSAVRSAYTIYSARARCVLGAPTEEELEADPELVGRREDPQLFGVSLRSASLQADSIVLLLASA